MKATKKTVSVPTSGTQVGNLDPDTAVHSTQSRAPTPCRKSIPADRSNQLGEVHVIDTAAVSDALESLWQNIRHSRQNIRHSRVHTVALLCLKSYKNYIYVETTTTYPDLIQARCNSVSFSVAPAFMHNAIAVAKSCTNHDHAC